MIGWSNMGAGQSLNFKVTRYNENTNLNNVVGSENEIAVLTNTDFIQWSVLSKLPSTPINTEIVIIIGDNVEHPSFQVTKKENVLVYPYYVMQYISGQWVGKISKIYQNGTWLSLNRILFDNGFNTELWEKNTSVYNQYYGNSGASAASYIRDVIHVQLNDSSCWKFAWITTKDLINRDVYSTLNIRISVMNNVGNASTNGGEIVLSSVNTGSMQNYTYYITSLQDGAKTYTIDISSIDNFYIALGAGYNCNSGGQNTNYSVDKVWLS